MRGKYSVGNGAGKCKNLLRHVHTYPTTFIDFCYPKVYIFTLPCQLTVERLARFVAIHKIVNNASKLEASAIRSGETHNRVISIYFSIWSFVAIAFKTALPCNHVKSRHYFKYRNMLYATGEVYPVVIWRESKQLVNVLL